MRVRARVRARARERVRVLPGRAHGAVGARLGRVAHAQLEGMQQRARGAARLLAVGVGVAVERVAEDWAAEVRGVYTDLVRAAGAKPDLEEGGGEGKGGKEGVREGERRGVVVGVSEGRASEITRRSMHVDGDQHRQRLMG